MAEPAKNPDELLRPPVVATMLDVTVDTLARWRCEGYGPTFRKIGRLVKYRRKDVEEWSESRAASSTSEAAPHRLSAG